MPAKVQIDNVVNITVTDEKRIEFTTNTAQGNVQLTGDFLLHYGQANALQLLCAQPFKVVVGDFFDTTPGSAAGKPAGQHGRSCNSAECPVQASAALPGPTFSSVAGIAGSTLTLTLKVGANNANKGVYKYSLIVDTADGSQAIIDPQIIVN